MNVTLAQNGLSKARCNAISKSRFQGASKRLPPHTEDRS